MNYKIGGCSVLLSVFRNWASLWLFIQYIKDQSEKKVFECLWNKHWSFQL